VFYTALNTNRPTINFISGSLSKEAQSAEEAEVINASMPYSHKYCKRPTHITNLCEYSWFISDPLTKNAVKRSPYTRSQCRSISASNICIFRRLLMKRPAYSARPHFLLLPSNISSPSRMISWSSTRLVTAAAAAAAACAAPRRSTLIQSEWSSFCLPTDRSVSSSAAGRMRSVNLRLPTAGSGSRRLAMSVRSLPASQH